jgi:diguanylate cyclase (GGDEF)-like protein
MVPVSAFRYVERTGEPLLVEDATRDDRFARDPYFARLDQCSLLVVPILSKGMAHAVLLLENHATRGAFSTERLDAVTLIAGQLTVSLDNAQLYASLERKVAERTAALEVANRRLLELSVTDALTGLANRRRFDEVLATEWLRGIRPQSSLGLVMIDIDHFKQYNDHYGHQAGDACLQLVAATLSKDLRQGSDLAARYGGEEFAIILPGAGTEATRRVAERIRAAVAALREPHVLADHGIVTVSVGITALIPSSETAIDHLLRKADAALYQAKNSGRNQVAGD